jgi:RNA polymerase sigma-70 factor (ECF subfamily)
MAGSGDLSMTKVDRIPQSSEVALSLPEPATKEAGSSSAGNDACFQAYQRELEYLLGSLRRLGVPRPDVEDVVHEVFLVMHRRWEDYDCDRPLRPWLFGIAFRVAAAQRRRGARELPSEAYESEALATAPDDAVAASETRGLLHQALVRVPLERRAVLLMHDVDEMPMREIAEQLELPLFTAYSRLRKARKELDSALARLQKAGRRC